MSRRDGIVFGLKTSEVFAFNADGNGNVMALVNAADGTVSAQYEYGPFGEMVRASGLMAKANPVRFSTKYQDDEGDLVYYGYRSYNPNQGRWLSRDPVGETAFFKDYVRRNPRLDMPRLLRESLLPQYALARNDPENRIDKIGLESEPDVTWAPAPCPNGQTAAYIQVVKRYRWSDGGPHVDNGSLGPKSSSSSGCPLYPVPPNAAFQDSPSGWTGPLEFLVCKVCLSSQNCPCFSSKPVPKDWKGKLQGFKIVSVGPCVYWKKGDHGDLGGGDFTIVDGPNQDWQVGMDRDFPDAAKGGCFTCKF